MIDFREIEPCDKALFDKYLPDGVERGCEFTFSNLYAWGVQSFAEISGHIALFSRFGKYSVYLYPIGEGDIRGVVDALISDSATRGVPLVIGGVTLRGVKVLEELYPGKFQFKYSSSSYDYVYDIDALANLSGRKYHGKRGHIKKFESAFPDYKIEEISENTLPRVKEFVYLWYAKRAEEGVFDYGLERDAILRALSSFSALSLDGIFLTANDEIVAVTLGSVMNKDTFDVQYEKALWDIDGAYPMINRAFARYIKQKHPDIRYLDREEDMGIEGLRKAKESYNPCRRIIKCKAVLRSDEKI